MGGNSLESSWIPLPVPTREDFPEGKATCLCHVDDILEAPTFKNGKLKAIDMLEGSSAYPTGKTSNLIMLSLRQNPTSKESAQFARQLVLAHVGTRIVPFFSASLRPKVFPPMKANATCQGGHLAWNSLQVWRKSLMGQNSAFSSKSACQLCFCRKLRVPKTGWFSCGGSPSWARRLPAWRRSPWPATAAARAAPGRRSRGRRPAGSKQPGATRAQSV